MAAIDDSQPVDDAPPAELTWHAHPARERPAAAVLAGFVIIAVGVGVALVLDARGWNAVLTSIVAMAVLVMSLNRFFLPSRFRIDADGITAEHPLRTTRLAWRDLHGLRTDRHGGFLATSSRRTWGSMHRGMHLLFGASRDEALRLIRARLASTPTEDRPS